MRSTPAALALSVLALLTVSACSDDSGRPGRDGSIGIVGVDGRMSVIRPGQDANAAYSQGLDLKTKGDCAGAIVKLRPVANMGPGYENAQTALGTCLLTIGAKNRELSSDYLDGLTWLRRAADAGWPEAQGALAAAHTFGPTTIRNGDEAAYWLALYQANPSKSRIGFTPIAQADVDAIAKTLTPAQQASGAERAAQWQRNVWLPPSPQPGSGPGLQRGPGPNGLNAADGSSGRGRR